MNPNPIPNEEQERRRLARISNNFFLRCRRVQEELVSEDEKAVGIVRDINLAGLAFLTHQDYREGEALELEIEFVGLKFSQNPQNGLLNSAAVIVRGNVARTETLESGLYLVAAIFGPMDNEDRALMQQAVSYQET